MPIRIDKNLPAALVLKDENIKFLSLDDKNPVQLNILILNIMPTKIATETQLLRLLSNSTFNTEVDFIHMATHTSKNTSSEHLSAFYKTFEQIKHKKYDGMIITGAPIEKLEFEEVNYWQELCQIMDWTVTNVHSTLYICWGAQAALYHHFGIGKFELNKKLSGVYNHKVLHPFHPLLKGFDDYYLAPHSRYTSVDTKELENHKDLTPLCVSDLAGLHVAASKDGRHIFVTGHAEYDRDTLKNEYLRDLNKGINPDIPHNYFIDDNPNNPPRFTWRAHANLLISNWINYYLHGKNPFNENDYKPNDLRN